MKPTGATVKTLPERLTELAPELRFPSKKLRLSQLRKLRDRLNQQGLVKTGVSIAREVAKKEPGRESYFVLGTLYHDAGQFRKALTTFRDALRFEDGPQYLLAEIHVHTAEAWKGLGNWKRMSGALRRAYSTRYKPRNVASLHMSLGNYFLGSRKFRSAAEEFEKAEKAYQDRKGEARAAANRGFACLRAGDMAAAARHLDRALRKQKGWATPSETGVARMMRASVHLDQGHLQLAFSMMQRAARDFRAAGKLQREAEALSNAGYIAGELENWARCRVFQDRAIRLASESGSWRCLVPAYALRATACAFLEDFEGASSDMARAQMLLRGRRYWLGTLHVSRAQAKISALFGNWIRVRRVARGAERLSMKVGDTPRVVEFRRMRALAEENLGRRRKALYARKGASRLERLLVSGSPQMRQLSNCLKRLSTTDLPVLIKGESGTGRSSLAEELHRLSRRAGKSVVIVPCEQMVFPQADLYGHVAGAWSGARTDKAGFVDRAEGGTLVLDRVDELSPADQRILKSLLDGQVRRVGSEKVRDVNVRVLGICSDPKRLIREIRTRIGGAVLAVPGLRERRQEIPEMVRTILEGRRQITQDALATLADLQWEGNIPELKAMVNRLVAGTTKYIGRKAVLSELKTSDSCRDRKRVDKKRHLAQLAALLA